MRFIFTSRCLLAAVVSLCFTLGLSAQTLQEAAAPKKVYIGNILSNAHIDNPAGFNDGMADQHLTAEYNAVVLENYMKMSFVLPGNEPANIHDLTVEELRATLTEQNIETFLGRPEWEGLRKRGHAMIWFSQAPGWLNSSGPGWTGQQVFAFSRKYIMALGQICGDRVDEWDVLNEAISDQSPGGQRVWRSGTWYQRANDGSMTDWGEATYENYVKMLFVWAREAQPQARLYYNDYSIEQFSNAVSSKNRFMRDKFKALKDCGAPIDGIGFQSHFVLANMVSSTGNINAGFLTGIRTTMEDLDVAGLDVAITELDIRICNNDRDEDFQEVAFREFTQMALSQPNCRELMIWGLRDEDNWITLTNSPPFDGCQDAVIAEAPGYTKKAAYDGVTAGITSLADRDEFGFAELNPGNGAPADCGGEGSLDPLITSVSGPENVQIGDTAVVSVGYIATGDQDLFVVFQLDSDPYTVYTTTQLDVSAGSESIDVEVVIPETVPELANAFQYQVFIAPDGGNWDTRFSNLEQVDVSVGDFVPVSIVAVDAPGSVPRGENATVIVDYIAGEGHEVVVWFQLDDAPYTTFQEVRTPVEAGEGRLEVSILIPGEVPVADDDYQFQTLLVPTGGGWEQRLSNIELRDVDVTMSTGIDNGVYGGLSLKAFPNPVGEALTVEFPVTYRSFSYNLFGITGQQLLSGTGDTGDGRARIPTAGLPGGTYVLLVKCGDETGRVLITKR